MNKIYFFFIIISIYSLFIPKYSVIAENLEDTPETEYDDSTTLEPTNPAPTVIPPDYIKSIENNCFHFRVPSNYTSIIPINYLQIFSDSLSIEASIKQIMPSLQYDISIILNFNAERSEINNITHYTISSINKDECFIYSTNNEMLNLLKVLFQKEINEYSYIPITDEKLQELLGSTIDSILNNATVLVKSMIEQFDLSFFKLEFLNPQTQRYVKYSVVSGVINGTLLPLAEGNEIDCKYVTPVKRARSLYEDCIDYGSVFDISINMVNNTIYSRLTSNMNLGGGMGTAELRVYAKLLYERIPMFNYTVLNLTTILRNDTYVTVNDDTTLGIMQLVLDRSISAGEHIPFNDLNPIFEDILGLHNDYDIIESIGLGYMDDYHFYAYENRSAFLEVYDYKFEATKLSPCIPNTEAEDDGIWIFTYNSLLLLFSFLVIII